jgi:crossover junction endodeoxyribonuclease RusA
MSGPKPPISMNDRMNHFAKAKLIRAVRAETYWKARNEKIPRLAKCRVEITWVVPDSRRRDEDNPMATGKAVFDGIVDAGVVPDDTPEYMEKPTVKIEKRKGQRTWFVTVYEVPPEGL